MAGHSSAVGNTGWLAERLSADPAKQKATSKITPVRELTDRFICTPPTFD
jgi:hypothetical protein